MFSPLGLKYLIPWMCIAVLFLATIFWFAFSGKKQEDSKKSEGC